MKLLRYNLIVALILSTQSISAQLIGAGGDHSLISCPEGGLRSCGRNYTGQLANPSVTDYANSFLPILVQDSIIQLTGSTANSFFLTNTGSVWAVGSSYSGILGQGIVGNSTSTPLQVHGPNNNGLLSEIKYIASYDYHALAVKNDGTVWAWGDNYWGQLGDSTTTDASSPIQVHGENNLGFLTDILAVSVGHRHSLALKTDGTVWVWGLNEYGQLGDSTKTQSMTPKRVKGIDNAIAIASGEKSSFAILADGRVLSWGANDYGMLGDGAFTDKLWPVEATALSGIVAMDAGQNHSLALKNDGTLWIAGIGSGSTYEHNQLSEVKGISKIAVGRAHNLALDSVGTLWTFGDNTSGQLGNSSTSGSDTPIPIISACDPIIVSVSELASTTPLFSIEPNPSSGLIDLLFAKSFKGNLEVFNMLGQKLREYNINGQVIQLDLTGLPDACYYVTLNAGLQTITRRVFIQH